MQVLHIVFTFSCILNFAGVFFTSKSLSGTGQLEN